MEKKKYTRLTYKERVIIEALLKENKRPCHIARQLNRPRSTITRELKKWILKPTDLYEASLAHFDAKETHKDKKNVSKIAMHSLLRFYVYRGLLNDLSPETIAGRIKILYPANEIMRISYESIYNYIYKLRNKKLRDKLISLLYFHKPKRRVSIHYRASTLGVLKF